MNWYLKVLKNYANFEGRARRKEYWMYTLFNIIIIYGIMGIAVAIELPELVALNLLYLLAVMIPTIAVAIRRMHDLGKSGWYILIPIYSLILTLTPGEEASNEYGSDPKKEPMP